MKILHTLLGVGSAAPAAAVPCLGKVRSTREKKQALLRAEETRIKEAQPDSRPERRHRQKADGVRQGLLPIMWVFSATVGAAAKSEPSTAPGPQLLKTERCTWLLKKVAFVHHNESDHS